MSNQYHEDTIRMSIMWSCDDCQGDKNLLWRRRKRRSVERVTKEIHVQFEGTYQYDEGSYYEYDIRETRRVNEKWSFDIL